MEADAKRIGRPDYCAENLRRAKPAAANPTSSMRSVAGSGTTTRYPTPPPPGERVGIRVREWAPAPSRKSPLLIPATVRQAAGSSPQSVTPSGREVEPRLAPLSYTWNRSPDSSTSVTRKRPGLERLKVQGGASRKDVGVPLLGMQNGPAGSAGSQPVAGIPESVNPNSRNVLTGIGPARASTAATARSATLSPSAARTTDRYMSPTVSSCQHVAPSKR